MAGINEQFQQCQYCGAAMYATQRINHEQTCINHPPNADAAKAALVATSVDGAIGSQRAYDTARAAYPGAAAAQTLAKRLGDWSKVAEWAGLEAHYNRGWINDNDLAEHVEELRAVAEHAEDDYPLMPGIWKRKTYAIWPSRKIVTTIVYELR